MANKKAKTLLSKAAKHQRHMEKRLIAAKDSNADLRYKNQRLEARTWRQHFLIESYQKEIAELKEKLAKLIDDSDRLNRENVLLNCKVAELNILLLNKMED